MMGEQADHMDGAQAAVWGDGDRVLQECGADLAILPRVFARDRQFRATAERAGKMQLGRPAQHAGLEEADDHGAQAIDAPTVLGDEIRADAGEEAQAPIRRRQAKQVLAQAPDLIRQELPKNAHVLTPRATAPSFAASLSLDRKYCGPTGCGRRNG